jgi:putative RecB family exonuclease
MDGGEGADRLFAAGDLISGSSMGLYSHSRLGVYETCPRQYRFQYVDRLEVADEAEAIQLFLGSRVHEALEALHRELLRGRLLSLDELVNVFRHHWEREWPKRVRFPNPDDSPETYRAAGERHLTDYYRRYHPFDRERTVAVERLLLFPLDPEGQVRVQGYVDRLSVSPDGVWEIRDYKTGAYLMTQQQLDRDRQLALYQIGVQHAWPEARRVQLVWHFLAHDLELRSERTDEQLETVRRDVLALVDRVEADQEYPTKVGAYCDWCPYKPVCPAWRHVEATAELPPERFRQDAGVQLVDHYAALKAEERRIAAELEEAQQKLATFAEQEALERIQGTGHVATVKRTTVAKFPGKGDPARPELERALKEQGKWEEVSELSLRAVARALEAARWPASFSGAISQFAQWVKAARIRLKKTRHEGE